MPPGKVRQTPWVLYRILVTYLVVPFTAHAALRGLFSNHGFWHRTAKERGS